MSPSYANGCGEAFPANITVFRPHSARFFARKSRRPTQLCIQGRSPTLRFLTKSQVDAGWDRNL